LAGWGLRCEGYRRTYYLLPFAATESVGLPGAATWVPARSAKGEGNRDRENGSGNV